MRDYLADDIGEVLVDDHGRLPEGAGVHAALHAARGAEAPQALHGRHPAVHALPDREPDRVGVRAQGAAALGRQHRHRLHRGAGVHRHQLRARHARQRHRDHGDEHQPRSGGRDRAPAAHPRHRRPDRHRLHRHGVDEEPARRRGPAARCHEDGPRAHPDRPPVALRPARDVAPAPAAVARRVQPPRLPALRGHRQHPQRRIHGARHPAPHRRGAAQGPHRARHRAGAGGSGHLPHQREARMAAHARGQERGRAA